MISPYFEENGAIIDANIILKAPCEKTGESEQRGKTDQQVMSPPRFQIANSRVSRNNSRPILLWYSKKESRKAKLSNFVLEGNRSQVSNKRAGWNKGAGWVDFLFITC